MRLDLHRFPVQYRKELARLNRFGQDSTWVRAAKPYLAIALDPELAAEDLSELAAVFALVVNLTPHYQIIAHCTNERVNPIIEINQNTNVLNDAAIVLCCGGIEFYNRMRKLATSVYYWSSITNDQAIFLRGDERLAIGPVSSVTGLQLAEALHGLDQVDVDINLGLGRMQFTSPVAIDIYADDEHLDIDKELKASLEYSQGFSIRLHGNPPDSMVANIMQHCLVNRMEFWLVQCEWDVECPL